MADDYFSRNRIWLVLLGIAVLAGVAGGAYYLGTRNKVETVEQQVERAGVGPQLTRLPTQRFGSWALSCVQNVQGAKRCTLGLIVMERARKQAILKLGFVATRKGPAMVALTPPNALIPAGFTMVPEKSQGVRVPYTRCMPRACEAIFLLSDQLATSLRTAAHLQVRFVAGNGHPVAFQIPIAGFADGYAAWQNQDPAAHAMPPPAPAPAATSANGKAPPKPAKPEIVPKAAPAAPASGN